MHHSWRIGALSLNTGGPGQPGSGAPPAATGLCLRIAGWSAVVDVAEPGLRDSLRRAFSRFVLPGVPEGASVPRVVLTTPAEPRPAPAVRQMPQVHREADGTLTLEGEDYSARLSADGLRATVTGQGSFPVETVLKVLLAAELARRGGLLVHRYLPGS